MLKKAVKRKMEEEEEDAEVASPVRGQKPEPQIVAEPLVRMRGTIVEEEEKEVWVVPMVQSTVAESRVALVVEQPKMAVVRLPKGKRWRMNRGSGEGRRDWGDFGLMGQKSIVMGLGLQRGLGV